MEKTMELIDVKILKSHYQFTFLHNSKKSNNVYNIFIFIKKNRLIKISKCTTYLYDDIVLSATCYSFRYGRSESYKCYLDLSKQQINYIANNLKFEIGLYKNSTKKMLNIFLNHELTKKVIGF